LDEALDYLKNTIKDNNTELWFLRIIQSLILLPQDRHRRFNSNYKNKHQNNNYILILIF